MLLLRATGGSAAVSYKMETATSGTALLAVT